MNLVNCIIFTKLNLYVILWMNCDIFADLPIFNPADFVDYGTPVQYVFSPNLVTQKLYTSTNYKPLYHQKEYL